MCKAYWHRAKQRGDIAKTLLRVFCAGLKNQPFFCMVIFDFSLAASAVKFFKLAQVPLATYFHSFTSASTLDWSAQEWVPLRLAQSFFARSGNAVALFFFLRDSGNGNQHGGKKRSCSGSDKGALGHDRNPG